VGRDFVTCGARHAEDGRPLVQGPPPRSRPARDPLAFVDALACLAQDTTAAGDARHIRPRQAPRRAIQASGRGGKGGAVWARRAKGRCRSVHVDGVHEGLHDNDRRRERTLRRARAVNGSPSFRQLPLSGSEEERGRDPMRERVRGNEWRPHQTTGPRVRQLAVLKAGD